MRCFAMFCCFAVALCLSSQVSAQTCPNCPQITVTINGVPTTAGVTTTPQVITTSPGPVRTVLAAPFYAAGNLFSGCGCPTAYGYSYGGGYSYGYYPNYHRGPTVYSHVATPYGFYGRPVVYSYRR